MSCTETVQVERKANHVVTKYQKVRLMVDSKRIKVIYISSLKKCADTFKTVPVLEALIEKKRKLSVVPPEISGEKLMGRDVMRSQWCDIAQVSSTVIDSEGEFTVCVCYIELSCSWIPMR